MFRCKWKACVNNMSGECTALNKEVNIDGRIHILDEDNCPFYKPKNGLGMNCVSNARLMYFCDRTMCGERCNRSCIYTPNVMYAVDPDGYPFGRSMTDGNFYQTPEVQMHRFTIDEAKNIVRESKKEEQK